MSDPKVNLNEWHTRKFPVPDPPDKPDFIQGPGNIHWSQFSRRLAAKLSDDKTRFDVQLYDASDTTALRLGPPSAMPDYPVLLEKYGLHVLEAAGFLSHPIPEAPSYIAGRLAYAHWRNPHQQGDIEIAIHPVLRRKEWVGITDHQYALMEPALLLATAILDDPVTLNYFYALGMPADSMDNVSHVSAGLTADCRIMKIPDVLDYNQQLDTFTKMSFMTVWLDNWGFADDDCYSEGYTQEVPNSLGWGLNNSRSIIRINPAFMQILECWDRAFYNVNDVNDVDGVNDADDFNDYSILFEDIRKMAGMPERDMDISSYSSGFYRTHVMLAATLLHEFTHAFANAQFDRPSRGSPQEPWAPGDRCNEQGYAFENFALGGVLQSNKIGIPPMSLKLLTLQKALVPFGFSTTSQWDVWDVNVKGAHYDTMDSDRRDDDEPVRLVYPVPQAWPQWLFTDNCWADYVVRYGLQSIKIPKHDKWGVPMYPGAKIGYHGTGEHRWNTGPSTGCEDRLPNWEVYYLDGIPEGESVFDNPTWDP